MRTDVVVGISAAILVLASGAARAHGEHKPGPHGGVVRMPGAFHTEIVRSGRTVLEIYLLDVNFQNPTTANSSVKAWVRRGKKESELACSAQGVRFRCVAPPEDALDEGALWVRAVRDRIEGAEYTYSLPLEAPAVPSGHVGEEPEKQ